MALSDRIALLRNGALEQIAPPREIYVHPATAYTAQFIGQTNLLRGDVRGGVATSGALSWQTSGADGPVLYSLRPEAIRLAADAPSSANAVRFRGAIRQQIYGGPSEILEIDCAGTPVLRARIPARGPLSGEHDFIFSAADAIRVKE
jgi:ABC-type Fe3+/spermidine/putrescine transport system ATPase subunit